MKKERMYNVFSLICNIVVLVCTTLAISNYFRTDVITQNDWVNFTGFQCFRFFTILSNVAVSISGAVLIYFNVRNIIYDEYKYPTWALKFKFVNTVAVTVTFLTVVFFLAPSSAFGGKGYFTLFAGMGFFVHFTNPILAVISFVLFEKIENFSFKQALWGMLPVLLYSILYITMVVFIGEENGGWPDFYYFTFGGKDWAVVFSAIAMNGASLGFSALVWGLQRYTNKRRARIDKKHLKTL